MVNYGTENYFKTEIIPIIQRRHDSIEMKHKLDGFVMSRKNSHITTVKFNFNIIPAETLQNGVVKVKYTRELDTNNDVSGENNFNNVFRHPDLQDVLKKQNILVDRLNKVLLGEKSVLRSDFASLIEEMNRLRNDTVTEKQIVIQPPVKPNTVVNIDETAIREALKKDPLVKRVLQMGKQKRVTYEKETKEFVKSK